jgi:hypothetical protein
MRTQQDWRYPGPDFTVPATNTVLYIVQSTVLSSEMSAHLIRHISTILRRSRPLVPSLSSPLSALHFSPVFRLYSWSGQSQPANWSHLSDVYSRGVDLRPQETSTSPDASWAEHSRSRMPNLRPPKGPYAGKTTLFFELHDLLIYQSREEYRSEKRKRFRRAE